MLELITTAIKAAAPSIVAGLVDTFKVQSHDELASKIVADPNAQATLTAIEAKVMADIQQLSLDLITLYKDKD